MGDGLKRAFAATARTRWDGTVTPAMRSFLAALPGGGRSITVKELPMHADRAQDRARQACRRLGLATYGMGTNGRNGWARTVYGDQALGQVAPSPAPRGEETA